MLNASGILSPNGMTCWNGPESPGGESGQVYDLGVGFRFSCNPVNRWRADLCFTSTNHPTWPVLPEEEQGVCGELYKGIEPIIENTCEAEPGAFLLDFGNFYPLGGTDTDVPHGSKITKFSTVDSCLCEFHVYVDENLDPLLVKNNLYWYPAESSQAMWRWDLPGMIQFYETMPEIGTPLHPEIPPTVGQPPPPQRKSDPLPDELAQQLEDL